MYIQHCFLIIPFVIQINDYKVVLEGPMAYLDPYDVTDPLSCKAICEHLSFRKRLNHLKIYVIINWSELNRIGPSSIPLQINASAKMFHLLKLTHIFPANKTVSTFTLKLSILRFLELSIYHAN